MQTHSLSPGCLDHGGVLCYCVTTHHRPRRLKQHTAIVSLFLWSEVRAPLGPQAVGKVLTRVWFSSGGMARVEYASKLPRVVGQIHFLMVVGPQAPAS